MGLSRRLVDSLWQLHAMMSILYLESTAKAGVKELPIFRTKPILSLMLKHLPEKPGLLESGVRMYDVKIIEILRNPVIDWPFLA